MQGNQSHYIYLNTRDRDEGSNANAVFYIDKRTMPREFMLTLESIQFPHHMYPFSNERRATTIYWSEDTPATLQASITINRNYTGSTLASELTSVMSAASSRTYTASYDIDTKKIKISVDIGTFRILSGENDINSEIGFDEGLVLASEVEGSNPVDLSGTKYVDVVSSLGGGLNYNSTGAYSVLCRMPTSASFGEVVLYEPQLKHSIIGQNTNNSISIALRDDRGNYVQLGSNGYVGYAFQISRVGTLF